MILIILSLPIPNPGDASVSELSPHTVHYDLLGLVSFGGTGRDDISMQFASRDFRAIFSSSGMVDFSKSDFNYCMQSIRSKLRGLC